MKLRYLKAGLPKKCLLTAYKALLTLYLPPVDSCLLPLEFKNNVNFWNVNANDSFKTTKDIKSSIVKSDGNNNTADTYVKTTDSGYDGTLTWIVMVTMDKNATKYTITDNMPEGISVQNVTVKLKYNNSDKGFTYPTLDGKSYKVENLNGKNYYTE